jgi:predicted nucleic acid-binding protein
MRKVYLDTCIAIYVLERHHVHGRALQQRLIDPSGAPAVQIVTSELVRLECRLKPMREGNHALLSRYDAFFALPSHQWVPLDRTVFEAATRLRAGHRLKTPDALHLAAALTGGCDEFWTQDLHLSTAAGGQIAVLPVVQA